MPQLFFLLLFLLFPFPTFYLRAIFLCGHKQIDLKLQHKVENRLSS